MIEVLPISNYEEADTRLIFHAGMSNEAAVIVAKRYGLVFTSNFWFRSIRICFPIWNLKIDFDQFINIPMIYDNLESEVSDSLPQLYAVSGCNTTSYKSNVRKVPVLKKFVMISLASL